MRLIEESRGFSPIYKRRVAMAALDVLSSAFNVSVSKMLTSSRQRASVASARQIAMYLCNVVGQLSLREIAIEFDREPSTVSHACHVIEDRRDDGVFDRQITFLEDAMRERVRELIDAEVSGKPSGRRAPAPLAILETKCAAVA